MAVEIVRAFLVAALLVLPAAGCAPAEAVPSSPSAEATPSADPRSADCVVRRLDAVADPANLFPLPAGTPCLVVAWDTAMPGVAVGLSGLANLPVALAEAAERAGFLQRCWAGVMTAEGFTPETRRDFVGRFGALHADADRWMVSVFEPPDTVGDLACERWLAGVRP